MPNVIDSIQLSGITYQIEGSGGGGIVDPSLDPTSRNPVANSAITTALDDKVNVVDNEVPDYNVTNEIGYQGGYPSQSETASTWDDASMFTLRYNFFRISDTNYITTAAVIDPSGNITTGSVTTDETSIANPLPDYIDMSFSSADNAYRFTAKEGYRIAHLDIYISEWVTWGYIREERVETVFEGGQSADVIKDVIEPTLINKQDTLVSGTNIKTVNNQSLLGSGNINIQGGGKAIEAGRGITITTGETADTVSFNLPISAGTGTNSIIEGNRTIANGSYSHAEGYESSASGSYSHAEGVSTYAKGSYSHTEGNSTRANDSSSHAEGNRTIANGNYSHAEGYYTKTTNQSEHASGQYNNSVSASTTFGDGGNTLFSVGNGTADNARHNAFEIRQNGNIYITSGGTDILLQDNLGGGTETIELTQAQYDALTVKDPNTYYIITDAQAGDLTNYYTKTETNTLLGGKQATLVSGTNIKTINNESILGSGNIDIQGGSTYTAGRGISIANDTISVSLPISAGTGSNSIAEGDNTTASGIYGSHAEGYHTRATGWGAHAEGNNTLARGNYSHAEGDQTAASGNYSHAEGFGTIANNLVEHASGQYNVSSKANNTFGNSGNTLFSVGNGTSAYARHNAFEIRQNGDIYLTLDGQDVKLQDQLGGSSITVDTALDSGSTNPVENRVIYNKIDEVEQVTAAALNNINDRLSEDEEVTAAGLNALNDNFGGLKLVKLTQAEYNALATKDSSTLYIIVN